MFAVRGYQLRGPGCPHSVQLDGEPADAPTQCQTGHTGGVDEATRDRQTVGLRRAIQLAPGRTAAARYSARRRMTWIFFRLLRSIISLSSQTAYPP